MNRTPFSDDGAFDRAWAAFARHDRAEGAPAALEIRLRRSMTSRAPAEVRPSPWRQRRAAVRVGAGLAACLVAVVAGGWWARPIPVRSPPATLLAASPAVAFPEAAAPVPLVSGLVLPTPARSAGVRPARGRHVAPPPPAAPSAIAAFAANGPLQVIRVRIAASALDALGVAVTGPAGTGLVDVDLVVGADGWPMDVRRIRPVTIDGPSQ